MIEAEIRYLVKYVSHMLLNIEHACSTIPYLKLKITEYLKSLNRTQLIYYYTAHNGVEQWPPPSVICNLSNFLLFSIQLPEGTKLYL